MYTFFKFVLELLKSIMLKRNLEDCTMKIHVHQTNKMYYILSQKSRFLKKKFASIKSNYGVRKYDLR